MIAQYPGRCYICGAPITVGKDQYDIENKRSFHSLCVEQEENAPPNSETVRLAQRLGYRTAEASQGRIWPDIKRQSPCCEVCGTTVRVQATDGEIPELQEAATDYAKRMTMSLPNTDAELKILGYIQQDEALCKKCRAPIIWYRTPNMAMMPFDKNTLVTHWATCKFAESFRKKKP